MCIHHILCDSLTFLFLFFYYFKKNKNDFDLFDVNNNPNNHKNIPINKINKYYGNNTSKICF